MRPPVQVVWIVLVVALCPSPATAQSGQGGANSRFQGYNAYALDTLRIVDAFGEYAVKSGDLAKHEKFTTLHDRFVSIGIRAQELLDREAEWTTAPHELERQWKDVVRTCVEFRREIDPSLVTWASKKKEQGASSSDDWRAVAATQPEIPDDVLVEIRRQAAKDRPADDSTQQHVVERQIKAYRQWRAYDCMRSTPFHVYQFVRDKAARDYPGDYAAQLVVLDRQMAAYEQVQQYEAPLGVPATHLLRIKEKAAADHPDDFSTQLFVIKRDVDKYLQLRMRGASGNAIVGYILQR